MAALHPNSSITELFLSYMQHGQGSHLTQSVRTQRQRTFYLRIKPELGSLPICDLTEARFAKFADRLGARFSPGIQQAATTLMTGLYEYALQLRLVYDNPCHAMRHQSGNRPYSHSIYSDKDLRAIIRAISHTPLENLYGLEICLGLRASELLGITSNKIIDGGTRIIIDQHLVENKAIGHFKLSAQTQNYGRPRTVSLPSPAIRYLSSQLERIEHWQSIKGWTSPQGLIFDDPTRQMLTSSYIEKQNQRIRIMTGLPEFSLQRLRDTYCIRALQSGVSHKALQIHMGYWQIERIMQLYYSTAQPQQKDLTSTTSRYYANLEALSHEQ